MGHRQGGRIGRGPGRPRPVGPDPRLGAGRLVIGTGAEAIIPYDARSEAERVATIYTYLSPEQVLASPKILIGTPEGIANQILKRAEQLGLTHYVLRGASTDQLGSIATQVRGSTRSPH